MNYYAHTARDSDGTPDCNPAHWQPLSSHLHNVAVLAKQFAAPLGLAEEAELAGLLHDLGKYADGFQARLRNPAIHGINHWAAGTAAAAAFKAWSAAFAADGHHTGIPALNDTGAGPSLRETVQRFSDAKLRLELTGQCPENADELFGRFEKDGQRLPDISPHAIEDRFAEALRIRMTFSCLVDADFLDTERHFEPEKAGRRPVPGLQPGQALELLLNDLKVRPSDGPVNALRRQLLADCLRAAEKQPGSSPSPRLPAAAKRFRLSPLHSNTSTITTPRCGVTTRADFAG